MNDDLDPLDELLGACLDGTADEAARATVAADPHLAARLERWRAVARALAELPPVDPAEKEAAIGAALAAFEEIAPNGGVPLHPADTIAQRAQPPVVLDHERRRRRRSPTAWIAAVAALAVAAFGIGTRLGRGGDGGTLSSSATSAEAVDAAPKVASEPAPEYSSPAATNAERAGVPAINGPATVDTPDAGATTQTTARAPVGAGDGVDGSAGPSGGGSGQGPPELSSIDALRAYIITLSDSGRETGALDGSTLPSACADRGISGAGAGPVVWQGTAGELVLVPDRAAPTRAIVVDPACIELVAIDLP